MEQDSSTEADLLRAHGLGDARAFATLYDRYDRSCFQFIRRSVGVAHAAAAEDLHQETWAAVARSAAAYDAAKGSFEAWLFTIARRKVWDHLRRQKIVALSSSHEEAVAEVPDPDPSPLERAMSRQLAERLVLEVEALPLPQRETFVMFSVTGLSLEDISQITGSGIETIKSRLRYARTALRKTFADERATRV